VGFAIVWLVTACGGEESTGPLAREQKTPDPVEIDPAPASKLEPDPAEQRADEIEALLVIIEALAKLHDQHASDCSALAEAIAKFHGEHGRTLAEAPAELHATIDADAARRTRGRAWMESVMGAWMGRRNDPRFTAVTAELFGG